MRPLGNSCLKVHDSSLSAGDGGATVLPRAGRPRPRPRRRWPCRPPPRWRGRRHPAVVLGQRDDDAAAPLAGDLGAERAGPERRLDELLDLRDRHPELLLDELVQVHEVAQHGQVAGQEGGLGLRHQDPHLRHEVEAHGVLGQPVARGDVAGRGAGPQQRIPDHQRERAGHPHRGRPVAEGVADHAAQRAGPGVEAGAQRRHARSRRPARRARRPRCGVACTPAARSTATTSEAAAAAPDPSPEPTGISEVQETSKPRMPVRSSRCAST